ncbi:MAG: rhodanese-like domain-containing protein [Saprospiraceae bacterium]|nr:rhodanese-like domain-containing protein [Saprospiraceae bacterium]
METILKNNLTNATISYTVADARKVIKENSAVFVDVRTEEEYQDGHIEGAVNIPFELLENAMESGHQENHPIFSTKQTVVF